MKDPVDEKSGLRAYRAKRNFRKTAEPKPEIPARRGARLLFVIQKHAASRLHYDFRLEMDGVLKSWAVPKGLPAKRGEHRLAVHVEDHPFDYAKFEGTIPAGNYGAGTVMVWDLGYYEIHGTDPVTALKEGKIHLSLKGNKLRGEWTLVRLKSRDGDNKDNWLIFKSTADVKPLSARQDDQSMLTGRSMKEIAQENDAEWLSNRSIKKPARPPPSAARIRLKKKHPHEGPVQPARPRRRLPQRGSPLSRR